MRDSQWPAASACSASFNNNSRTESSKRRVLLSVRLRRCRRAALYQVDITINQTPHRADVPHLLLLSLKPSRSRTCRR